MRTLKRFVSVLALGVILPNAAFAASTVVRGTISMTQGHESPACRTVGLRRQSDGQIMLFRIPATGLEDGIMAVTITALTMRLTVDVVYDPAQTTGCGSEPKIQYITIIAAS